MVDALGVFVPYSQTLLSDAAFDAYHKGHESGSRHAGAYAGKSGAPSEWPGDGPDGEPMEPDEGERDAAMERDADDLDVVTDNTTGSSRRCWTSSSVAA